MPMIPSDESQLDPCAPDSYHWWAQVPVVEGIAKWREIFKASTTTRIGDGVAASVVVPVYNAAPYLPQMLISLAAQTLENIEIICVDDGSSDGSRAVCETFAAHDARFKVLSQSNQGAAVARNNGLAASVGKWVMFVDADDFCRPEMLAEMVAEGEKGADVVVAARNTLDPQGRRKVLEIPIPKAYLALGETVTSDTEGLDVFTGFGLAPWNKLFRREFLMTQRLRFQPLPVSNDVAFVACSLLRATRIRLLAKAYYCYREGNLGGLVARRDRHPTAFLEALGAVGREVAGRSARVQTLFYKLAVRSGFWQLMRMQSAEGLRTVYCALRDDGLAALKGSAVDDGALDLGPLLGDAYDALIRREPLEMVLSALLTARRIRLDAANQDLRTSREKVASLRDKTSRLEAKVSELKQKNQTLREVNGKLKQKNQTLKEANGKLKQKLATVVSSTAYRLGRMATWPVRALRGFFKRKCATTPK